MTRKPVDLVVVFDATGSMYTALAKVKDCLVGLVKDLSGVLEDLKIGVIVHTDYDYSEPIRSLKVTDNCTAVVDFITATKSPGYGQTSDECYELALKECRSMGWRADAEKIVVMIGDCLPHARHTHESRRYYAGGELPRWDNEAKLLKQLGVKLHPVKVLDHGSEAFWNGLAKIFGTQTLEIDQLASVTDTIGLVGFAAAGLAESYVPRNDGPDYRRTLAKLTGKPISARSASIGSGYQVLQVPMDTAIREFVQSHSLEFVKGDGYYEWTKPETIQDYKKVLAVNKSTGAITTGKRARQVLGIGEGTGRYAPKKDCTHVGYVQSTSVNRKLISGTSFAYKMASV